MVGLPASLLARRAHPARYLPPPVLLRVPLAATGLTARLLACLHVWLAHPAVSLHWAKPRAGCARQAPSSTRTPPSARPALLAHTAGATDSPRALVAAQDLSRALWERQTALCAAQDPFCLPSAPRPVHSVLLDFFRQLQAPPSARLARRVPSPISQPVPW